MNAFLFITILTILLIFLIIFNFYLISLLISSFYGAPFVPTNKKKIRAILEKAGLKKNSYFYELGCGDGRIVDFAIKYYQVKGVGIEINPFFIVILKLKSWISGKKNPQYLFKNFFDINLKNANFIYCFLLPKQLLLLRKKFEKELKKGTVVISHGFKVPRWNKKIFDRIIDKPFPTYFYRF